MSQSKSGKGWLVTFSGTGINLALGILYTWSIFKGAIKESIESHAAGSFDWDLAALNDPYAICCLVFAFSMILAGKCQDRYGARITAFIGGILVGLGFIWISQTTAYLSWVMGFGVLAGAGIGFGYSAATPVALKWFPPEKTGLIAGLVVSGFGLASVYIAPLSQYLLNIWGLQKAMLFFGIAFLIIVCSLSMLLVEPLAIISEKKVNNLKNNGQPEGDFGPAEMMTTKSFYILWVIYFIGAGAGLMVIGSLAGMAKQSMGELAFIAVAIMAIGNAGGRITAGFVSDKIGRRTTLFFILLFQTVLMLIAIPVVGSKGTNTILLVLLATFIGFNYGTNLSLFPSFTKDLWGLKRFGMNYGIVFTAWGVGGFFMGRLSQMLQAYKGGYTYSFLTAALLLIIGSFLTLLLKKGKESGTIGQQKAALSHQVSG